MQLQKLTVYKSWIHKNDGQRNQPRTVPHLGDALFPHWTELERAFVGAAGDSAHTTGRRLPIALAVPARKRMVFPSILRMRRRRGTGRRRRRLHDEPICVTMSHIRSPNSKFERVVLDRKGCDPIFCRPKLGPAICKGAMSRVGQKLVGQFRYSALLWWAIQIATIRRGRAVCPTPRLIWAKI